jgi:V8-like Glu-specific endopeptidase
MQLRSLTTVSALMLGVALLATPVLAASSTPGGKGAADVSVNRDAPLTLPGKAAPKPTPTVDPSSLSRGIFGEDPAAALASMGTVTLSHDGSVTEQPASEGMRAIIEAMTKGNGEATADRVVVDKDTRKQITDASGYPDRVIGWLWTQDQKDQWATCTATLIGPYTVITAAHCVYDHPTGGWVKAMTFLPGMTDAENAPFGQFDWDTVNILKGFIDNYDGTNYGSVMPWDLAVITLSSDAGNQLGWMGFQVDDGSDFKAEMIGYPGDKPDGTMWDTTCTIPAKNFGDQIYVHDCDDYAGSSGSAMFQDAGGGDLYIRGINVAEDDKMNYGVRLIDSYYQFILDNYK